MMSVSRNTAIIKLHQREGRLQNCLIFNLLTRQAHLVSEELLAEAFDSLEFSVSKPALELRKQYSFLSEEQEAYLERQLFDMYMDRRRTTSKPYFFLIPTYSCNTACAYCWQTTLHDQTEVMSQAALDSALQAIERLMTCFEYASSRPTIEIFGGEPLQPHSISAVRRILDAVAARDWDAVVTTNGSLLNRYSSELLSYPNLLGVHVTVDGPRHIHNQRRPMKSPATSGNLIQLAAIQGDPPPQMPSSPMSPTHLATSCQSDPFGNIMEGLDPIINAGKRVVMRINLNESNALHVPELLDYTKDRGWLGRQNFEVAIEPVTDNSCDSHGLNTPGVRLLKALIPALAKYPEVLFSVGHCGANVFDYLLNRGELPAPSFNRCGAENGTLFLLDLHGMIYTCIESAGFKKHAVGRFLPDFELNSMLKTWHARNVLNTPGCKTCNVKFVCGGGCGWNAFNQFGELLHSMCPPIRGQMEALFDHYYDVLLARVGQLSSDGMDSR